MGLVTRIENAISIPIDALVHRKGFHPVDLMRLADRCMERGCRQGIKRTYAPNRYRVLLNPHDYRELQPFLDLIRSEICGELRRVVDERNYLMAGNLTVEIEESEEAASGLPQVRGSMHGDSEPESTVCLSDPDDDVLRTPSPLLAEEPETIVELEAEDVVADEDTFTAETEDVRGDANEQTAHRSMEDIEGLRRRLAEISFAADLLGRHLESLRQEIALPQPEPPRRLDAPNQIAAAPIKLPVFKSPESVSPLRIEFSGQKALLRIAADGVWLENPSRNPEVTVNGEMVYFKLLQDGDLLRLGPVTAEISSSNRMSHIAEENEAKGNLLEILDLSA